NVPEPVRGADAAQIRKLIEQATAASGTHEIKLFGVKREEDFSQFKPRGHYVGEVSLERYFRAQMWLGRVDLRILETQSDGRQVFRRDQYLATLLLYGLV